MNRILFDMTNSLQTWTGGIVGIVRTELMLARNLKKIYPLTRFVVFNGSNFVDVTDNCNWLCDNRPLSELYAEYNRKNRKNFYKKQISHDLLFEEPEIVKMARAVSPSRLTRLKICVSELIDLLPRTLQPLIRIPARGVYRALSMVVSVKKRENDIKLVKSQRQDTIFREGDVFFTCGWYTSGKEEAIEKIKNEVQGIKVGYLVYDLVILNPETSRFYSNQVEKFKWYIEWISNNADFVVYCGDTAKKDTEDYWRKTGNTIPNGYAVEFGSDIVKSDVRCTTEDVRKKYDIEDNFILTVGTLTPKKNIRVLYLAYNILAEHKKLDEVPQLIIAGEIADDFDLASFILEQPGINKKIKIIQPTDEELEMLYRHCQFALLTSFYEGRSVVLSEILDHGKFCLCADVPPLKELGRDLVKYLPPTEPKRWAFEILELSKNQNLIESLEKKVRENWKPVTWHQFANNIFSIIEKESCSNKITQSNHTRTIYYDITFITTDVQLTGIPRVQFILARELNKINKNIKFFTYTDSFKILPKSKLKNILGGIEIDEAVLRDKRNFSNQMTGPNDDVKINKLKHAIALFLTLIPQKYEKTILKFARNHRQELKNKKVYDEIKLQDFEFLSDKDVVFTTSSLFYKAKELIAAKNKFKFKYAQVIYDLTPIIIPHTHLQITKDNFKDSLNFAYKVSDLLIYGGKTALNDSLHYQESNNIPAVTSKFIKFGSSIPGKVSYDENEIEKVLKKYGIKDKFIMTVGTIQARKNQQILYEACLYLLRCGYTNIPQIIICGRSGWRASDFIKVLTADSRVKELVKLITPSDFELGILYKKCMFTLLPSLYEGWSLTLPESLNYGKFCLVSRTPALMEIGEDLVEYLDPYDPTEWANSIIKYATNEKLLADREAYIRKHWTNTSWSDCAKELNDILINM